MKSKKLKTKLSLNKNTIVNLDNKSMEDLQGGYEQSINRTNCPLCPTESCAKTVCYPSYDTNCDSLCSGPICC